MFVFELKSPVAVPFLDESALSVELKVLSSVVDSVPDVVSLFVAVFLAVLFDVSV